ncbi:MAG: rod shape-determining protein MreC [Candidatus Omnitrophica bacterium]|nr:rod shape-determining protein MreC [Candidatus Omnitrophota bacterium]
MFRAHRKNLVYFFFVLAFFILLFTGARSFHVVKFSVIKITSIPIRILSFPLGEIKKLLFYHLTFDEYKRLKEETDVLKARLVGLEEVISENKRFEDLLKFKRRLVYSSVVANVVGRNPSYWNSSMIIDRGGEDGIRQGMPVVNAAGVVGKIAEVGPHISKVILLTDPQFSVAALVQGPRESGLVSGTLKGVCRMRYVRPGAKIDIGEKVITSKLSSSFPEGLLIGEITAIDDGAKNPTVEYLVEPSVAFSQIEEVLVILN